MLTPNREQGNRCPRTADKVGLVLHPEMREIMDPYYI